MNKFRGLFERMKAAEKALEKLPHNFRTVFLLEYLQEKEEQRKRLAQRPLIKSTAVKVHHKKKRPYTKRDPNFWKERNKKRS